MTKKERTYVETIAENVRRHCYVHNINMDTMAHRSGISPGTLYNRLRGDNTWRLCELIKVAEICGTTPQELMERRLAI